MPPKKIETIPVNMVFELLRDMYQRCTVQLDIALDEQAKLDGDAINRVAIERRIIKKISDQFESITTKESEE